MLAGLVVAATLLLVVGPRAARALGRPRSPAASAPSLSRVSGSQQRPATRQRAETPSASPSPSRSGAYRVVGLGDSVPAGDECDCTSYVSLVGRHEAQRRGGSAVVANLAQGGLTTAGLLDQLEDSSVRHQISAANLVIVTIGANDFDPDPVADDSCRAPDVSCFRSTLRQQAAQLDAVLEKVDGLLGDRSATVLITGYWNVFLDGDVAAANGDDYVRNSIALTQTENAQIAAAAQARGATYVDLLTAFKGASGTKDDTPLLADDGDHPNAAGHAKIAEALESVLASR
ncbi:SGNH/GDSL hydrolase family protein [Krasilnikovia sp. MM14-A1259]|uniref:SGNH/GDSL hydrolase family protein n=1 Tax=Krasilnikovia sp. MM14-A1259 TaxID=3373539 RepID=UPI00399D209D